MNGKEKTVEMTNPQSVRVTRKLRVYGCKRCGGMFYLAEYDRPRACPCCGGRTAEFSQTQQEQP